MNSMKSSKNIFVFIFMLALFASCNKDLGNYDYTQVPDFEINGVKTQYSVTSYIEQFVVPTTIVSEDKSSEYDYVWTIYYTDLDKKVHNDTISKEPELDVLLKYLPGAYMLQLKVTNKNTNLAKFVTSELEITTPFSRAYYLLKETSNGNTEMDIHYDDKEATKDAITKFYNSSLPGKPRSLSYMSEYSYLDEVSGKRIVNALIIPASEKQSLTFSLADMSIARNYEQWFYDTPIDMKDYYFFCDGGYTYHFYYRNAAINSYQAASWGLLSSGKITNIGDLPDDGKQYVLSPIINPMGAGSICYDELNGRFLVYDYNGSMHAVSHQNSQIKPGAIKDKLIFMGKTNIGAARYGTAIFQDNNGGKYMYLSDLSAIAFSFKYNITNKLSINPSSNLFNAGKIAANRYASKYLYCVNNNQLYAVNFENLDETKLTLTDLPIGEISFMDTMYCTLGDEGSSDKYNYFVIAVYNAGKYSVLFYNMIGGIPSGAPVKTLSGDGKICNIQITSPVKTSGSTDENWSVHY